MSYNVIWSEQSKQNLKHLDAGTRDRIISRVEAAKENPYAYAKRLVGVPLYSLRVGDYRIILDIKNKEMLVFVVRVGHRSKVYYKLG
ncbi:MAG: type II toxin-antitoxin system RelE/ParE family toxin [Candidatus Micrarchaeota archaeon]|nr:type II toxin-antitoxin system RelE/ParE family toxin [Candidatus Micrarchaeota archaeon]